MALFNNTAARLPRIGFVRGGDLRMDAARAIGQAQAVQSAGSPGAVSELAAFFAACSALLSGAAPGSTAQVTDGQKFKVGVGGTARDLTVNVSNGALTFTLA